ncbi:MAG: hypothetical protein KA998_05675, partial [Rickettsiaceae bacterium]|nr:hypothetical protein [Rickettsiaceae bacterium]
MPHINQSSIQEIVENAQEGEILNIKEVLESRGFAPDLSTLTIDFSNNKSSLVNFTGIDLTLAEIKNLDHSKSVIFEDGSSTLSPFNPDSLIRNYSFQQSTLVLSHITKLNYTGVCFGIAVEMARYIAKRKAQNRNADIKKLSREFIVKLFRKTKNLDKNMNYKSSDNFLRRIMIYQTSQTFSGMIKKHRINRNVDSSKRSGFFETMPEDIKNARMIGIGYGASKNRGHIINIFREQDNIGRNRYIIFDSNIGLVPRNHIIDESEKYYYTSDEIARFVNSKAAEKKFCCYNFDKILDELNLTSSKLGENPNDINQERCLLNIKTLETSLTKLDQMLADKNRAPNTEKRILPYINLSLEIIDQLSEREIRNNPQFLR